MSKKLFAGVMLGMMLLPGAWAADYGLPEGIQEGNILHCFNWPAKDIEAALPEIAAAGFGSVQLSPLQRPDANTGSPWHDLYRPYDLAFKSSGYCSEQDLKDLCSAAAEYGIKIIVDIVANHVDKTAGYHDIWWDSNGRVRWDGGINYGDRHSITHGQLGDYGDVNSELSEVASRGKAYVEKLKELGVKGCRWDAAKHIGLPSEGCNFWSTVTSVPGMYHYGEILDNPGPDPSIIKQYVTYMSVTDNKYSNGAAKDNGGIPGGYGGDWVVNQGCPDTKMVYWAESHDTYSNDEWSQNVDQSTIDRAYAAYACRKGATALYLSRPNTKGFSNIKVGKGSTAFSSKHIAEVNKFRNVMTGKADWFESNGNACSITRKDGGAVIVMKGSGNVSVTNGGSYCPAGTYTDRVSGGTFTVTASTISGNVGSSGIAVIYADGITPTPTPDDPIVEPSDPITITGDYNLAYSGDKKLVHYWGSTASVWPGVEMTTVTASDGRSYKVAKVPAGTTGCLFNNGGDDSKTGDLIYTAEFVMNDNGATSVKVIFSNGGDDPNPPTPPTPDDPIDDQTHYIYYDGTFNSPTVWAWTGPVNCCSNVTWPGDLMTKKDGKWYWELPAGKPLPENVIISENGGDKIGSGDLAYVDKATYHQDGTYTLSGNDDPNPPTPPVPGTLTITGDYNLAYNGDKSLVHYWGSTASNWPGVEMTVVKGSDGRSYKVTKVPEGTTGCLFNNGGDDSKTADLEYTSQFVMDDNGKTSIAVVFSNGDVPTPQKPVVNADPASGTIFTGDAISVTLSVTPEATIYYSLDSTATTNSIRYTSPITVDRSLTISTLAVTAEGVENAQSFTYTKKKIDDPVIPVEPGDNLITDYYKVNPNRQTGSNRTVTMNFSNGKSSTALSNWTESDLIAQGVARDVCQAFKGLHERPIVDSYSLYAAFDSQNLYLGVQFVYAIWDFYGAGKQPDESKPYNMDGHMVWAFDLDPENSFDGYIDGEGPIWNEAASGAKFDNGVDAVLMCSTKPGVGIPGLFLPTPDGHASYDASYCKALPAGFFAYADGLLPSIDHVWGQPLGTDPEALTGNTGFVDIRNEIDDSAHTFYEFKIPLSLLGIDEEYIKSHGIGVMYLDKYGSSPVGGTPYDPSYFDNVNSSYSQDPSSSKEKEDEDIITYAPARIGKELSTSVKIIPSMEDEEIEPVYYDMQGLRVRNPQNGLYIVVKGDKVSKQLIRR